MFGLAHGSVQAGEDKITKGYQLHGCHGLYVTK